MFRLVDMTRDHLTAVLGDKMNKEYLPIFTSDVGKYMANDPYSKAIVRKNEVYLVGGVQMLWEGRGNVWCLFSEKCRQHFLPVFRLMKKYIESLDIKRLEMHVPWDNKKIKRRAELLGFTEYCPRARNYTKNWDAALFERVNNGG